MATFQDIENQMRVLREGDPVVLKLMYKGHFRSIHGTVKDVGPVPSIVTDDRSEERRVGKECRL